MKSTLNHLQLNINFKKNIQFYKELMDFLKWEIIFEMGGDVIGYKGGGDTSIWFVNAMHQEKSNYDNYGMNHLGFSVDSQADVDLAADFLRSKKIELLFETPRHRPEFSAGEKETYYQVMFESPDGILFEIVYSGEKS